MSNPFNSIAYTSVVYLFCYRWTFLALHQVLLKSWRVEDGDRETNQRIVEENDEGTVDTATKIEEAILLIQGKICRTTQEAISYCSFIS